MLNTYKKSIDAAEVDRTLPSGMDHLRLLIRTPRDLSCHDFSYYCNT